MVKTVLINLECHKLVVMCIERSLIDDFKFNFLGNYILGEIKVV